VVVVVVAVTYWRYWVYVSTSCGPSTVAVVVVLVERIVGDAVV
jgi:hypothetical protein